MEAIQDENADGVIDRREDEIAARRMSTTYAAGSSEPIRTSVAPERFADESTVRATAAPVLTADRPTTTVPTVDRVPVSPTARVFTRDDSEVVAPIGPRPRASMFATLALVVGVLAMVAVATGELAGPGIGLGVLAALLSFVGISATGRRHVAGRADAILGLLLGLVAIVVGVLCLTGKLPWLTPTTNLLSNLHDWLQAHASWMLPS